MDFPAALPPAWPYNVSLRPGTIMFGKMEDMSWLKIQGSQCIRCHVCTIAASPIRGARAILNPDTRSGIVLDNGAEPVKIIVDLDHPWLEAWRCMTEGLQEAAKSARMHDCLSRIAPTLPLPSAQGVVLLTRRT